MELAKSESEELDLESGELPLCFDADAGGGRFLAIFTFLNRKDGEVKLHPFLVFKGSDSRKNLEITFGRFTEEIRNLEGKEIMIKDKVVKLKLYGLFDLCRSALLIASLESKITVQLTHVRGPQLVKSTYNQRIILAKITQIQVQEGDLAADPPELYVAPDTPSVFQTYFCNLWPELEKYLKTAGNMEICFKSSVFYTKNKNSKQYFSLSQTTYNICMHTFWLN